MLVIDKKKLERAHSQLVKRVGDQVTWGEFANRVGVSLNTLTNIRHGHTTGSPSTLTKIILGLNKEGVKVTENDLVTER